MRFFDVNDDGSFVSSWVTLCHVIKDCDENVLRAIGRVYGLGEENLQRGNIWEELCRWSPVLDGATNSGESLFSLDGPSYLEHLDPRLTSLVEEENSAEERSAELL